MAGLSDDGLFQAEIRLVNEQGFHKTILEKNTFNSNDQLIVLLKAFDEGRKFKVGLDSGNISANKAFDAALALTPKGPIYSSGFLLGYNHPIGKIEVVR